MINGKGIRVSLFVSGCTIVAEIALMRKLGMKTMEKNLLEKRKNEIIEYFKKSMRKQ